MTKRHYRLKAARDMAGCMIASAFIVASLPTIGVPVTHEQFAFLMVMTAIASAAWLATPD